MEAAGGAPAPTGRAATDSEVVQRGANVAKNPLQGAPGPPPFREKRALYNTQSPMLHALTRPGPKARRILYKLFFNLVWGGFEVGFGISVKNDADP